MCADPVWNRVGGADIFAVPMTLRLIEKLRAHAQDRPDAPILRRVAMPPGEFVTRHGLVEQVDAVTRHLHQHLPIGATILLCHSYAPEFVSAFLGVLNAGDTLFCVPVDSVAAELEMAARKSFAGGAIVSHQTAPLLRPLFREELELPELGARLLRQPRWECATATAGPALLLQSSGTTGEPKIVRRDGPSLDAVSRNMAEACGFAPDDRVLAAVPLSHSYGLEHGILAPVWAGSCVHIAESFELSVVFCELREGGVTLMPGVPFMFEMFCRGQGTKFPTLKNAYSAGGPLARQTYDCFRERFGLRLGQLYGATEVGSVTFSDPNAPGFDPESVGLPMHGVSLRIIDLDPPYAPLPAGSEGQVAIAAPSMLSGYATGEPAPLMDGHFLTGDIGRIDSRGALTITGRLKLLIDVGGRKVNPAEVESVISSHPDVGACVVVPMAVDPNVSRVKAILTPARPDVEISVQDLRRFARERLSAYKVPRVFEVRATLPTSPVGKVLRHLVETS